MSDILNLRRFKLCGLQKIVVQFNGHSDSGRIGDVTSIPAMDFSPEQIDGIQNLAEKVMQNHHLGDWSNNDGGQGTVTFMIKNDKMVYEIHCELNHEGGDSKTFHGRITDPNFKLDPTHTKTEISYDGGWNKIDWLYFNAYRNGEYVREDQLSNEYIKMLKDMATKILDKRVPDWKVGRGTFGDVFLRQKDGISSYTIKHNIRNSDHDDDDYSGNVGV